MPKTNGMSRKFTTNAYLPGTNFANSKKYPNESPVNRKTHNVLVIIFIFYGKLGYGLLIPGAISGPVNPAH
jgi:hypothetical protein